MKCNVNRVGLLVFMAMALPVLAADLGAVDVGGTFSQGYMNSDNNNYIEGSEDGTFDFREYGINAIGNVTHDLRLGAQIYAREYGTVGNDDPYLDWAYADYRPVDWAGIRLGRMKIPKGLYNETREIDALRTEILLPGAVYTEMARELVSSVDGVGLYGDLDLNQAGTLEYYVQYGQRGLDEEDGDFARLLDNFYFTLQDSDMGESYSGKLLWGTPIEGLDLATTYSGQSCELSGIQDVGKSLASQSGVPHEALAAYSRISPTVLDIEKTYVWVLSAEYSLGKWLLVAEYAKEGHDTMALRPGMAPQDVGRDAEGYYVKAGYGWSDRIDTAVGYSTFEDISMDTTSRDTYLSIRFDLTDNLILKFEEHFIQGTAGLFEYENPDGLTDDMTLFLAKVTMYF